MDIVTHLKTFTMVVSYGDFSEAARRLNIVPSVVAKRIAQLEEHVGAKLFDRTTRTVRLTEAGEKLSGKAGVLLSSFDDLIDSVGRDESKLEGHIRVMAPTTLAMAYLGEVFNGFLKLHDRITLEISLIDHSVNPAEEGFDLAISGRVATYPGVVEFPLCPVNCILCASPEYLSTRDHPDHPRDLIEHDCLVFKPSGFTWQFDGARGTISIDLKPRLVVDDNWTLLRACMSGLGIAAIPAYVAMQEVQSGRLIKLLDKYELQNNWFKAYVPTRRQSVARVAALTDWLCRSFSSTSWESRAGFDLEYRNQLEASSMRNEILQIN